MASLREAYATAAQIPGFREVRRTIPHLAIWDDHDYGQNDAGAEFASKRQAQALFLDFWSAPASDARRAPRGRV